MKLWIIMGENKIKTELTMLLNSLSLVQITALSEYNTNAYCKIFLPIFKNNF